MALSLAAEKTDPNPGITLCFKDLTYQTNKGVNIIDRVTGYAKPGRTHFIMGASGAGKTTLLDILANRISPAKRKKKNARGFSG